MRSSRFSSSGAGRDRTWGIRHVLNVRPDDDQPAPARTAATSLERNAAVVGEFDAHLAVARRHGPGKAGTATLFVDGNKVAEGRVEATVPMILSGDEL